jgi:hypothetical protein
MHRALVPLAMRVPFDPTAQLRTVLLALQSLLDGLMDSVSTFDPTGLASVVWGIMQY